MVTHTYDELDSRRMLNSRKKADQRKEEELRFLNSRKKSAEFLGVSERQLDAWIARGVINATRLGRLVKVHRDELERVAREGIS